MITVFNLSPTLDISASLDRPLASGVSRTREITSSYSGKGSNTAMTLAQSGVKCRLSGFMPVRERAQLESRYKIKNLFFDPVYTPGFSRPCLIIKTPETEYVINSSAGAAPGAALRHLLISRIKKFSLLSKAAVFSGSLAAALPVNFYAECISACGGRCTTILDTSGDALKAGIKAGPQILKINLTEAGEAFDTPLSSKKTVLNLMKNLCGSYGVKSVVFTDGARPVRVFSENNYSEYKPAAAKGPVFATGAGDAFTAGLCYGIEKGLPFKKCLLTALKFAAVKIKKPAA